MDKKTQMYLGVAVLAVAGYMLWKKSQDKKKAAAPALPASTTTASFAGTDMNTVVGRRAKMVGLVKQNEQVVDSGWVRADGTIAPTFFDVQSSKWIGR